MTLLTATLDGCINITDPLNPIVFRTTVAFDTEYPLQLTFGFGEPPALWTVARQLIIDGTEATLLTGMGDFRCRASATRFIVRLISPEGDPAPDSTISLPLQPIVSLLGEAEYACPLAEVLVELDDKDIAAWLDGTS